jgi:hypothetical protein
MAAVAVATNELIYKYPTVLQLALRDIGYLHHRLYFNPHENVYDNIRHKVYPNMIDNFYLSRNPSRIAYQIMMHSPSIVRIDSLVFNTNPQIAPLLEDLADLFVTFHWTFISKSQVPEILAILEKYPNKINSGALNMNKCDAAMHILKKYPRKIIPSLLWANSNSLAFQILEDNNVPIDWSALCENTNPKAIEMIKQMLIEDPSKIDFNTLSANPSAIHILSQNLDKVSPTNLSKNTNAMELLLQNPDLIEFPAILENRSALPYLETHLVFIRDNYINNLHKTVNGVPLIQKMWDLNLINEQDIQIFLNSKMKFYIFDRLFELDYAAMSKARARAIYPELIADVFHPRRVAKRLDEHCDNGGSIWDFEV